MLTVTDNAVKRFQKILDEQGGENSGIRIFMSGGGCCGGSSVTMDITDGAKDGDKIIKIDDLSIFVDKQAVNLLAAATIDYSDDQGFVVRGMPRSSCCG